MARLIAIDLGAHAVKVTSYTGSGKQHEFEGAYSQRVPLDELGGSALEERLASLDLLLREHPEWIADAHLVEVALSSSVLSLHRLKLPFNDTAQIEQTLPFAIEEEIPHDLATFALAWRKADDDGLVHAGLVQRGMLAGLCSGLAERTLDPRAVRSSGESLARFAYDEEEVIAIVDVGHEHTEVCVARGGEALFFRAADTAGRTFTLGIQNALGCTWADAEALKHGSSEDEDSITQATIDLDHTDPAFGAHLPSRAREVVQHTLQQLLAEVRALLVHAEDELGLEVDALVLVGGGSQLDHLRTHFAQDLGIPVRDAKDDDGLPMRPEMAVGRALAAQMGDDGVAGRLDLRVGDMAFRGGMDTTRALLTYGAAGLGFFLAAVVMMFAWQFQSLSSEQDAVRARIIESMVAANPELAGAIEDMDSTTMASELSSMVMEAQSEVDFLGDGNEIPETVDLLYRLTKAFPPHPTVKVDIDELDISPVAVRIAGVTAEVDAIADRLRESGQFGKVTHDPGQKKAEGLNFTVNIDRMTDDAADDTDLDEEG